MAEFVVPKVFQPLWEPARYKGAHGGRGSGKSFNFATMAVVRSAQEPGLRGACVREVQKSLKESSQRLIGDTITRLGLNQRFDVLSSEIRTPGNGSIIFQGMQDHTAQSILSFEGLDWVWIEQAESLSAFSLELLRPTIRKPGSEIWASWNPNNAADAIEMLRGLDAPRDSVIVEANYQDNPFFTAELELERQHDEIHNRDRYNHTWEGGYEPQAIGAIWHRQTLHAGRVSKMPCARERTLIGVDPAVTDNDASNEHGIVAGCKGEDGQGYILEDASTHGTPHQWATRAVALYDKWDADAVVIEINQGGDMCKHTLQTIRKGLPVIEVRATRGKHVRAEPISALYTTGLIHHVGTFPEMEDQLCKFTAHGWDGDADKSPDRAEAGIWLLTELYDELIRDQGRDKSKDDDDEAKYFKGTVGPGAGAWMA